ncbi:hypothetical protein NL676_020213 [Syzygium grande]|nr:hypothetical protein NL676_020213 [Syzygium grande]
MISGDQISGPHRLPDQLHQYRHNLLDGLHHHFQPLLHVLGLVLRSGGGGTAKRSTEDDEEGGGGSWRLQNRGSEGEASHASMK